MKGKLFPFRHFWATDAGLTGILVFLLLYFMALYPLAHLPFAKFLTLLFFSLLLISGVILVFHRPLGRLVAGGLVLITLGLVWTNFFIHSAALEIWDNLAALLALGFLTMMLLSQVFQKGDITYHHICGSIAAYFLLAWIWAGIYSLLLQVEPGAIQLPPAAAAGTREELQAHLLYFSVITLTTLGYGDIIPISPTARLWVMLEALVGQLYPAITLAWLVSMEIVSRTQKK